MQNTEKQKLAIEEIIQLKGFNDFKWINPGKDIIVSHWVRMKCLFGCSSYHEKATCPPHVPSVKECQNFFKEYSKGIVFHFQKRLDDPEERKPFSKKINKILNQIEKKVFLLGYPKTFVLHMDECRLCKECTKDRKTCLNKEDARPGPEGMAVDVFGTVRGVGYPIEVLKGYEETMNRYAFLLIQ